MTEPFKPVSNGFSFACTSSYEMEDTVSKSQQIQAEHVDLTATNTSTANTNMINAEDAWIKEEPPEYPNPKDHSKPDPDWSTKMQEWQTKYNLINTKGQMYVNELQTESQNGGTNLQAVGNFIQNLIQVQSAILSPLNTVTTLLPNAY